MSKLIGWNRPNSGGKVVGWADNGDAYEIIPDKVRDTKWFTVYCEGEHVGSKGTLGLAKELAEYDAERRSRGAARSNPSTRYRKVVKVSRKRNPEGWHEYLTGGVKNWSKTLGSGAKIVITEPWKGGWSMYQVNYHPPGKSYGTAHFSNADTLSEAFAAGNRAVKYYEAQKRNPATSDAQVIKAFTEQRAASSSKLQTDGRRLDGLWMGGGGIAAWEGDKIVFYDLGSKAADAVRRQVVRAIPRNWIHANSVWVLPMSTLRKEGYGSAMGRKKNPLSPYAKMQRKAGFKAPPKPKFKIGYYVEDNYGDGDLHTRPGRVTFVGSYTEPYAAYEKGGVAYEGHSGGYKYKVQEPDGRTLWRDEQRLRRIKAPRSRKNLPSSGLGGTYAIMHANPFEGPLTITHDGPDLHITHKANPRRRRR